MLPENRHRILTREDEPLVVAKPAHLRAERREVEPGDARGGHLDDVSPQLEQLVRQRL